MLKGFFVKKGCGLSGERLEKPENIENTTFLMFLYKRRVKNFDLKCTTFLT